MEKLEKKLNSKILDFNNAKEWSDLMQIISDLNSTLKKSIEKQNINLSNLKDKIQLSKRLAQCLNPSLPAGLHENALQSYHIILKNIMEHNENNLGINLALFSSGLFPFFINASQSNKIKYLEEIVIEIFLNLSPTELEICLPGLLVSILPALEEQNEKIGATIKNIFDQIIKKLSYNVFYGCLWSIMIRNQSLRQAGMKYILENIPSFSVYISKNENEKKELLNNYYPNFSTMVLNTLCALIEDEALANIRVGMDFIIKCLPISKENNILTDDEKIRLLVSCFGLLLKNEYSTTRRFRSWILGNATEEEIDLDSDEIKYLISLLISALKEIFSINRYRNRNNADSFLMDNLKSTEQFFNQQVTLCDSILEHISINIINCVVFYWENELNSNEKLSGDKIIKKTQAFFNKDQVSIELLWKSLSKSLNQIINDLFINKKNDKNNQENDVDDKNSINKTEVNNNDALSIPNLLIEDSINSLKFCLIYLNSSDPSRKIKYYMPIISNLLKLVINYDIKEREDFQRVLHIVFMSLVFLKALQDIQTKNLSGKKNAGSINAQNFLVQSIDEIYSDAEKNNIFENKFKISPESQLESIKTNEDFISLSEEFTANLELFQQFYIKLLDILLNVNTDEQITRNEMRIFKYCTEIIIRAQEYSQESNVPEWLKYLEKIVFSGNFELALEASDYLLDLLNINMKGNVYNLIKKDIKSSQLDESIITNENLNRLISFTNNSPVCNEMLVSYLWMSLDDQENQKRVLDLLVKISKIDMEIFINTISNTLANIDFENNINAINLFTKFWKISNEYYPDLIFFKNGECIFKMLDYLDDPHPLLRHLSKSWLNQSVDNFNKIIDPLLSLLTSKDIKWKIDENSRLLLTQVYDNKRVMDAFRKLKNIIINTSELSIKYFIEQQSSRELVDQDLIGKKLDEVPSNRIPRQKYLGLLVSISLRFIQGKLIDSLPKSFEKDNYAVNAASCEFLEFLLSFIEHKDELMKIAFYIALPVIELLYNTIEKNDGAMQVQLLNLLNVLLFNTRSVHGEYRQQVLEIFNSNILLLCIVKGIRVSFFFVKGHFISFMENCLPIFSEVLDKEDLLNIAKNLVQTTSEYIRERVKYLKSDKNKYKNNFSQLNPDGESFIVKNYLDEYKEMKRFDENDILIILKGLKTILYHFLEIKSEEYEKYIYINHITSNKKDGSLSESLKNNWEAFQKQLVLNSKSNGISFGGLLLGIFGDKNELLNEQSESAYKISKEIYDGQLKEILNCLLSPWINQSDRYEPFDFCLSSNGILMYPFCNVNMNSDNDSNNIQNNFADEMIGNINDYDRKNKKSIKSQIIEVSLFLFLKNPVDFMNNFIILWIKINDSNNHQTKDSKKDKQCKLSMIELLMNMKIPFNIILYCINQVMKSNSRENYNLNNNKMYTIPTVSSNDNINNIAIYESNLCHLIYSYILLNKFEINKKNSINDPKEIWREMNTFINKMIESTKFSYTLCWLYEILNIMVAKFPVSHLTKEFEIKKDLTEIYYTLNKRLIKISINQKFEAIYEDDDYLLVPILPSIYTNTISENCPKYNLYLKTSELSQRSYSSSLKNSNSGNQDIKMNNSLYIKINKEENINFTLKGETNKFYQEYYSLQKSNNKLSAASLNEIYRIITFLCLKNNYLFISCNLFSDKPNEIIRLFSIIIPKLLLLMRSCPMQGTQALYNELSVEFLYNIISNCGKLATLAGKQVIMDYFNEDFFFKTSPKVIRIWKEIIRNLSEYYKDIISDLLNQMSFGVLFIKAKNQTKIKMLRRISFVIYSCEKDKFTKNFGNLKEKVVELLTTYSEVNILECEIFLMIRVLFLRYSHDNIMEMIKSLWPIIFTELLSIINNSKNRTIKLLFESLKFIELLSLANIEEFSLYQWVFIIDTFDIRKLNINDNESNDGKSLLIKVLENKNKIFTPITMKICSDESWKNEYDNYKGNNQPKSELVIVSDHNAKDENQSQMTEEELGNLLKKFFYSIGDMNNYTVQVNYQQIEKVIEEDFLYDSVDTANK